MVHNAQNAPLSQKQDKNDTRNKKKKKCHRHSHPNGFMELDFPDQLLQIVCSKCMSCCKAILVLAARARCFNVGAVCKNGNKTNPGI